MEISQTLEVGNHAPNQNGDIYNMSKASSFGAYARSFQSKVVTDGEKNDVLWQNWDYIFQNTGFEKIHREYNVYGTLNNWELDTSSGISGWRIDYVARYRGTRYLIEAKFGSFDVPYSGFKIFAYKAAYCIDRGMNPTKRLGQMIFFTDKIFDRRMRYVCAVANVEYAVFNVNKEYYELKECSLWK